jgi:DNA-binding PadR family transcriptional regulator
MEDFSERNPEVNPIALGAAYLDYCVRQGWLVKSGEGSTVQYALTPLGEEKLADVPFNFDLSKLTRTGNSRKKRRRHLK